MYKALNTFTTVIMPKWFKSVLFKNNLAPSKIYQVKEAAVEYLVKAPNTAR